ncbi:two component transcriptional regulator, winged helix family [Chthoniobacter flavus Ellin428]|uniref:Two component transcriptional regulator, winged helix family n=2 Tax=Chthoniobacter flavus TaxID=191863 RepID=B4DAQ3_9BACT|nr:two component transcriptional regulator, winged helix family [Chthoniobacter flavus Ellin428]TCO92734.1 DNA-binding response OmpR family regulator [Chthoniobacter flavus]
MSLFYNMRILVVEDDSRIASFVAKGFKQNGYLAEISSDGEDGLQKLQTAPFDAAVIDLMLPKMDGLSLIERIRKGKTPVAIVVLSAKHSVEDKVRCLRSGADDYLQKPFAISELLARVEAIVRRVSREAEVERLESAGVEIDLLAHIAKREGRRIDLQPREFALLELLVRNRGRALTKMQLLERLWDYSFDPQTNVVDVLVCRLRNKLDRGFDTKLIHTLRGIGYVFRPE